VLGQLQLAGKRLDQAATLNPEKFGEKARRFKEQMNLMGRKN